jgi:hypothetical protein
MRSYWYLATWLSRETWNCPFDHFRTDDIYTKHQGIKLAIRNSLANRAWTFSQYRRFALFPLPRRIEIAVDLLDMFRSIFVLF